MSQRSTQHLALEEYANQLIQRLADARELELVDLNFRRGKSGLRLEVTLDQSGGIGIDECTEFTRALRAELDENSDFDQVEFEVGSPGLTRPLKKATDFERFVGRIAVINLSEPLAGKRRLRGHLESYDKLNDCLRLRRDSTEELLEIPLTSIAKARLDFDFPTGRRAASATPRQEHGKHE